MVKHGIDLSDPRVRRNVKILGEYYWLFGLFHFGLSLKRFEFQVGSLETPANAEALAEILRLCPRENLFQASDRQICHVGACYTDGRASVGVTHLDGMRSYDDRTLLAALRPADDRQCVAVAVVTVKGDEPNYTWTCTVYRPGRAQLTQPDLQEIFRPLTKRRP